MQIRIGYSKSKIIGFPDSGMPSLLREFTYTNRSISYQYYQSLKQKRMKISWWMRQDHISEEEAFERYQRELDDLGGKRVVCLIRSINGTIEFPTGLLSKVVEFIKKTYSNFRDDFIVDERQKPESFHPFAAQQAFPDLRPYQKEALERCLISSQGTIESGTGTGKTVIIQELIRNLGVKAILIVPSQSILNQTLNRFIAYFGKKKIGQYGDGKKDIREITVACAPSVANSTSEEWKDIQACIFDESHHTPTNTIEKIRYSIIPNCFYVFGFTATSFRADGSDLAIEAAAFPIIYRYTLEQGIKDGYLAQPVFMMFRVPSYSHYSGDKILTAYKNHIMKNHYLNELVIKQIKSLLVANKQILVLVKEKFHGNLLQQLIPESVFVRNRESRSDEHYIAPYVDPDTAIGDFNTGKIRCLIGSSIISEGTDILPCDALFLLTGGLSKVSVLQSMGRGLRKCPGKSSVAIFDYIYTGHPLLEKHSLARKGYYKQVGDVTEFDVNKLGEVSEIKRT